jgi:hypothetical protein
LPIANGGTGATTAATARTGLGATTLGANLFTVANPSAVTFPRFNADNTVSSLNAADFRTAIGAGSGAGTVTSVGGTGTVNGITLTGTVTSSGNLTLGGTLAVTPSNFASQTAKTVLAAPNAAAGVPTFRLLVASDIPTLNQNTTGSAATLTTARTLTIGSTGKTFNGSANVTWSLAEIGAGDVTLAGTQTLTNKRVTPRSVDIASAATITPTGDTADQYEVTALAAGATIAAPSGTPTDGQKLVLRIKDNGTARALTWTTTSGAYRAVGVTLPTTTVISKVLYVGCVYNAQDSFWDVLAVAQLA